MKMFDYTLLMSAEFIIPCFIAAMILLVIVFILYARKNRELMLMERKEEISNSLTRALEIGKGLEGNLNDILSIISSIVQAPSYAIFLLDSKSNNFVLKSVRHATNEDLNIGPAYSGLLPYKKETFLMPTSIILENIMDHTTLMREGEVPLIYIPIRGKRSVVVVGPVKDVTKKELSLLDFVAEKSQSIIETLVVAEELKNQVKQVISSDRAVKNISNLFADSKSMLDIVMRISLNAVGSSAGLLVIESEQGFNIETIMGLDEETKEHIEKDIKTQQLLMNFVNSNSVTMLDKTNKEFFKIPPYFIAAEIELILLVRIATDKGNGVAVFLCKNNLNVKSYQVAALEIMAKRLGDIINNQIKFKELSNSYVDILKTLSKLLDNLSPSTIGYSELMYRYAVIISKEMKLNTKDVKEIALAAYFSNIGIIGLSDQILHKKGKYSEIDYEMMKLHAEAGASIIEATLGNQEIASYIRYHHERIDGYGYPEGISGEEIPLGARIIAVIQTFLAKIMGRDYRSALPFNKALEQLRAASGTQLDPNITEILIKWFERKQVENRNSTKSLGYCWEMRCSPENICITCPAYKNARKNCWEIQGVNCEAHGSSSCKSCFVHTEYLSRVRSKYV